MSDPDSDLIYDIISYLMIEIGALFSLLNMILILSNRKTMLRNVYGRLMLIIQTLHLGACIADTPYYSYDKQK
jgi:hypothetical protein